jgi:hypothetical protein
MIMRSFEQPWPQTHRVLQLFAQMDLMMERLGVDPKVATRKSGGAAIAQARNVCRSCNLDRECREWLKKPEEFSSPPGFCRNAKFFRECVHAGLW